MYIYIWVCVYVCVYVPSLHCKGKDVSISFICTIDAPLAIITCLAFSDVVITCCRCWFHIAVIWNKRQNLLLLSISKQFKINDDKCAFDLLRICRDFIKNINAIVHVSSYIVHVSSYIVHVSLYIVHVSLYIVHVSSFFQLSICVDI